MRRSCEKDMSTGLADTGTGMDFQTILRKSPIIAAVRDVAGISPDIWHLQPTLSRFANAAGRAS
jgi:hypothetical protein